MTENSNDCGMMNSTLLPVGEAVEGPSICFRLVELGGGDADGATGCHGMRHNKFMALMMDATDNRMTLEDVEEAWQQHVGAANVVVEKKGEESDDDTTMTVQSFVRAFSDLARAKYLHGGAGTVNRLLLRDVLGNNSAIGKIPSAPPLQARSAHLARKDVCSFLLSQRSFTTDIFAKYCGDDTWCALQDWGVDGEQLAAIGESPGEADRPRPVRRQGGWEAAMTENRRMRWADFLALASDLQLVPYLVGIEVLKATMETVFSATHRTQGGHERGNVCAEPSFHRGADKARSTGMLYPQFVEALCLLATAAAGRLRSLYPDVAGKEPSIGRTHEVDGILADESLGPKAVGYGASRIGNRSTLERDQAPVPMPFVTQGWSGVMKEKTGGKSSELSGSRRTRATVASDSGENRLISPFLTDAKTTEARPYDLGALNALFYHAKAAHSEQNIQGKHGRLRTSSDSASRHTEEWDTDSMPTIGPSKPERDASAQGNCVPPTLRWKGITSTEGAGSDRLMDGRIRDADNSVLHGNIWQDHLERGSTVKDAASVLDEVNRRVAELAIEILPREEYNGGREGGSGGECDTHCSNGRRVEKDLTKTVAGNGAGGRFARLVVVKELQPVPEHAPNDVRPLLELVLDHQQAGRFILALETLEKARTLWVRVLEEEGSRLLVTGQPADWLSTEREDMGSTRSSDVDGRAGDGAVQNMAERSPGYSSPPGKQRQGGGLLARLEPADQILLLLVEASIHQTAGEDNDALHTLLKAHTSIDTIRQGDPLLKAALRASVLNEMGMTVYYADRPTLGLWCFRLALTLRHKLLQLSQHLSNAGENYALQASAATARAPPFEGQDSCYPSVTAVELAAALVLNNVGVCLARVGQMGCAAQALNISSRITMSSLGVQHPRSAVLVRNLAIVKAGGGRSSRNRTVDGRVVSKSETDMWISLDGRRWAANTFDTSRATRPPSRGLSHVISGGFVFAGKLVAVGADNGGLDARKGAGRKKKELERKKKGINQSHK